MSGNHCCLETDFRDCTRWCSPGIQMDREGRWQRSTSQRRSLYRWGMFWSYFLSLRSFYWWKIHTRYQPFCYAQFCLRPLLSHPWSQLEVRPRALIQVHLSFNSFVKSVVPNIATYALIPILRLTFTRQDFKQASWSLGWLSTPFCVIAALWNRTFSYALRYFEQSLTPEN